MRKIAPILFKFVYDESLNSMGVNNAYNRIFELARKKMELDNKSTKEYSEKYGRDGDVLNTGGSSEENEGKVDYCLQNVSGRESASDKVWRSLENKSKETLEVIKGERR